jgi:hypothetical protein
MEEEMLWEYKGKQFPNKKDLRFHFQLSSCQFDAKVKYQEIKKLKTTSSSYENKF